MGRGRDKIVVQPEDRAYLARAGLDSVAGVLKYQPSTVAAVSGSSETFPVCVGAAGDVEKLVFVKRYRYRGWARKLKNTFRGTLFGASRAAFEFAFLAEARRRKIPAVRPVAYGEQRRGVFLRACFLITEGQVGTLPLDAFAAQKKGATWIDRNARRLFVEELASVIRDMHASGVMHGGLFWRNILVGNADVGGGRFYILDPARRGRILAGKLPDSGIRSDLADLAASAAVFARSSDLMCFAKAYFGTSRLSASQKELLRRIGRLAKRQARQEAHRVAVGQTIGWLNSRKAQTNGRIHFDTVDEFFDHVASADLSGTTLAGTEHTIQFEFSDGDETGTVVHYTLRSNGEGVLIARDSTGKADLSIGTDTQTWLSVINGQADALDLVRSRRIRVTGNTQLLPLLASLIET